MRSWWLWMFVNSSSATFQVPKGSLAQRPRCLAHRWPCQWSQRNGRNAGGPRRAVSDWTGQSSKLTGNSRKSNVLGSKQRASQRVSLFWDISIFVLLYGARYTSKIDIWSSSPAGQAQEGPRAEASGSRKIGRTRRKVSFCRRVQQMNFWFSVSNMKNIEELKVHVWKSPFLYGPCNSRGTTWHRWTLQAAEPAQRGICHM